MIINGDKSNGAATSGRNVRIEGVKNLSFECNGCGQCFESSERLRQHAIDCGDDDSVSEL
jgi:hypothetical protein